MEYVGEVIDDTEMEVPGVLCSMSCAVYLVFNVLCCMYVCDVSESSFYVWVYRDVCKINKRITRPIEISILWN